MDKLIWLLFSVNLLFQASTCMFAPFFPGIAKEERGLSLFMIGLTMSISSVAFVIFSYIAGHIIKYIGRRQSIYFGLAITGVAMIGFGVLYWITNYTMFVLFALFLRFICGVGQGLVSVSCYAIATIKYKDSLQQKLGLLEAGNGAGFLAGPLFGGIIYQLTHFSVPFFICCILLFIQIYFLKQTLDESCDSEIVNSKNDEISYVYLLRHKRIFFATIAQFLNIFILTYGQPIFGPRMENDYHFPVAVIGAIYAIPCISYALTGPIFLQKIAKNFEYRTTIMIGFMIIFAGGICIGPSRLLYFPNMSAGLMITGISILGVGEAFTIVPIIPEMMDAIEHQEKAHDKISAIFNIAGGFGQIVAPLLSGWLTDKIGFNLSLDVCAIIVLSFLITYFINCEGFSSMKRSFLKTCRRENDRNIISIQNSSVIESNAA